MNQTRSLTRELARGDISVVDDVKRSVPRLDDEIGSRAGLMGDAMIRNDEG
jgi:hypothetical protein